MASRIVAVCVAVSLPWLVLTRSQSFLPVSAAAPPGFIALQRSAGVVSSLFAPGGDFTLAATEPSLALAGPCTGTWTAISATVPAGTWWSLASGVPQAGAYSLSAGCAYSRTSPASTPLALPPQGQLPWVASVNGVSVLVADFKASAGEIKLLANANAGSTVQVAFFFDVSAVPTPTPTPIPGASRMALALLGALLALVLSWRLLARKSPPAPG